MNTTNYGWIEHSIHVGNTAFVIAEHLGLDAEKTKILGYIHDIECTAGGHPDDIPFRTEFIKNHTYTIYEKIICLCDLLCTSHGVTLLEKRLVDIMIRRGIHDNTIYHIQNAKKLKKEIDEMLGYNLYDLFPNIYTD